MRLKREEGAALADGGDVYDALLDEYEPGATGAELQAVFNDMRPGLVALRQRALNHPERPPVSSTFDPQKQMKLARELARLFGYDPIYAPLEH